MLVVLAILCLSTDLVQLGWALNFVTVLVLFPILPFPLCSTGGPQVQLF